MNEPTDPQTTLHRDSALATTLRDVVEHLGANTGLAYLLDEDRRTLRTAIVAGAQPAIYIMPERVDVDAPYATAAAFRTGQMTMAGFAAPYYPDLKLASRIPFPYSVISLPLDAESSRLGVLTFAWVPPRTRFLHAHEIAWLTDRAEDLGRTLHTLLGQGVDMRPGTKPALIPLYQPKSHAAQADNSGWGLPHVPGSTEVSFMYQVHQLAAELNEAASIDEIMQVARDRVMAPFGASAFVVSTLKDGRLWITGHSGYPTVALRLLHGQAAGPHRPDADALLTHTPLFFEDHATLTQAYPHAVDDELEATAHLPLILKDRLTGVCTLGFGRPRTFSSQERAVAMMMMDLLGPAIERASLDENARSLAENLQKKLLPRDLVEVPGITTTARYLPAPSTAGLGGDWYDMIPLPAGRLALVIGDVEGHSIESCVVMGQLRSAVRAYTTEGHPPDAVMTRANRLLNALDTDLMATCCLTTVDPSTGVAETALAGHPPPLIRTPNGQIAAPDLPPGIPLGIDPETTYTADETPLSPDTLLILYTDGLTHTHTHDTILWTHTLDTTTSPPPHAPPSATPAQVAPSLDTLADHLIDQATTHGTHHDDVALLLAHYEGPHLGPNRRIKRTTFHRHDLRAVKAARQFITDNLHQWGLDDLIDNFQLITSEIVTNALIHADSDVDLRLREYPDHLRLEVRDTNPTPPIPTPITQTLEQNQQAEHGRGLNIVDTLSTQWGNTPSGRGKTIWVDIYNT
ncbi:SpoIIE family protein phosphatase [Streptomyces sp900105245]|uniref:ATP-binding SpoIIE family protein phosphatase n=1 Tax=Streptomyces sp. 900105245 TaxID=3154379 RepID=UPI00332AC8E8